jgi:hypothetical protein
VLKNDRDPVPRVFSCGKMIGRWSRRSFYIEKSWGGVFFVQFFVAVGWERSPLLFFLFLNYIACIIVYDLGFFFKGFMNFFSFCCRLFSFIWIGRKICEKCIKIFSIPCLVVYASPFAGSRSAKRPPRIPPTTGSILPLQTKYYFLPFSAS